MKRYLNCGKRVSRLTSKPKILIYDIETSQLECSTWGIRDQFISHEQIKKDWHLVAWAAKWVGTNEMLYADQRKQRNKSDDKKLVLGLWKLLDKADIVITKNGKQFDQPRVYARCAVHGINPPAPYEHIDVQQIAKRKFAFTSNSLAYLAKALGVEPKDEHKKFPGRELWDECEKGNLAAWREMEKYNKQDVRTTEAVYLKLRAWDAPVNISGVGPGCPACGVGRLERHGLRVTVAGVRQRYRCVGCGHWCQGAANLLPKEQRAEIKRRIA